MKYLILFLITSFAFAQDVVRSTFDKSKLDPTEDEAKMKGTDTALEELNTAPSPVPRSGDDDQTPTIVEPKVRQSQEDDEILDEEEEP